MFPQQVPGFLPSFAAGNFPGPAPIVADALQPAARLVPPVQITDIYQAAKQRAVEDHELDRLFNAEFYGDGI